MEEARMLSVHSRLPALGLLMRCIVGLACLITIAAGSAARAQSGPDAIYGVTALDVAPDAVAKGVAALKQYRDAARKQTGNLGVDLLQEAGWPNRFAIYETWKDQAAYDANEKAAHTAELRDKLGPIAGSPYDRRDYRVVSVGPPPAAAATASGNTIYMQLHLDVFPPGIETTLAAAMAVAEAARKSEGNLRYDV